jgi:hypothetical protein
MTPELHFNSLYSVYAGAFDSKLTGVLQWWLSQPLCAGLYDIIRRGSSIQVWPFSRSQLIGFASRGPYLQKATSLLLWHV